MQEREDRQKLINEKIKAMEDAERHELSLVREATYEFLTKYRGYGPEDIERDPEFAVEVEGCNDRTSTDFIVRVSGKRYIAIRCAASSVESRERHALSFARTVDEFQIPLCLVTDGQTSRILDTRTGSLISDNIEDVPSKDEAEVKVQAATFSPCPAERIEREKRILLAFDSLRCKAGDL